MAITARKETRQQESRSKLPIVVGALVGIVILTVVVVIARQKWQISGWIRDLDSENFGIRKEATDGLVQAGPKAVTAVQKALQEKSGTGLAAAVQVAGKMNDPSLIPPLIKILSNEDPLVRQCAAKSLGNLKASEAGELLTNCLDDSVMEVRRNAARALGRLGDDAKPAVPKLIGLLSSNKEPSQARSAYAAALGDIGDASAVDALARALDPRDFELAQASATALGKIGSPKAVAPLSRLLTTGVSDEEGRMNPENVPPGIRISAIEALEKINSKEALPVLRRCADEKVTISYLVREAAKKAMQKLGE